LVVVQSNLERLVRVDILDIGSKMAQNLKRQVTKRFLGALNSLARVGLSKGQSQVLASSLDTARLAGLGDLGFGNFSKGLEVFNAIFEVCVVDAGLEAELVHDGAGEGYNEVEGGAISCQSTMLTAREK
jgi:hypothetical protein